MFTMKLLELTLENNNVLYMLNDTEQELLSIQLIFLKPIFTFRYRRTRISNKLK